MHDNFWSITFEVGQLVKNLDKTLSLHTSYRNILIILELEEKNYLAR
jgi:hypothetical protein